MRNNSIYLALLVLSGVVFTLFICPFLEMHGLTWVCVLFYILLVLTFIYGRIVWPRTGGQRPPR